METQNFGNMKSKKKSSKKAIIIGSVIGLFVLGSIVGVVALNQVELVDKKNGEIVELNAQNEELNQQLVEQEQTIEEMMATFDEIEYNLDIIHHKEKLVEGHSSNSTELDEEMRDEIVQDIQFINTLLNKSQDQVADLQKQLKRSGREMASFKNKATKLSAQLEEKGEEIAALKGQLEESEFATQELNAAMDELVAEVQRQKEVLESVDRELHTAYIAKGTYKELSERGLVDKEGGVLWLGRTKTLEESAPMNQFTAVDTREITNLVVDAKKAKLITKHPEDSYKFEEVDGEIAMLQITNPDKFWRVSDHLVLEVKK